MILIDVMSAMRVLRPSVRLIILSPPHEPELVIRAV